MKKLILTTLLMTNISFTANAGIKTRTILCKYKGHNALPCSTEHATVTLLIKPKLFSLKPNDYSVQLDSNTPRQCFAPGFNSKMNGRMGALVSFPSSGDLQFAKIEITQFLSREDIEGNIMSSKPAFTQVIFPDGTSEDSFKGQLIEAHISGATATGPKLTKYTTEFECNKI